MPSHVISVGISRREEDALNPPKVIKSNQEGEGRKIKIAIIGATGAVGKEIVLFAKQNSKFIGEIIFIVRRKLPEWDDDDMYWPIKLTFIFRDNFDNLTYTEDEMRHLEGVDAFICTLGSRQKYGSD